MIKDRNGKDVRLIKVKNPWKLIGDSSLTTSSHGEWVGRFNSKDKQWTDSMK
jgi:hypothetical protein